MMKHAWRVFRKPVRLAIRRDRVHLRTSNRNGPNGDSARAQETRGCHWNWRNRVLSPSFFA
jgi:hypothetical protein